MKNLKFCEWINFWEYTVKKWYQWIDIFENDKKIGVYSDSEYYINGFRKRINFENDLLKYQDNLIEFIERKMEEQQKRIIDLDCEKTKLESSNIELKKKLEENVVDQAKEFYISPN